MKAGYLQFYPKFGDTDFNIKKVEQLLKDSSFKLLVLPELANSGYLFSSEKELMESSEPVPDGKFCKFLRRLSRDKQAYIVSGLCERGGNDFYNSSVLVSPGGEINTYRKIQLFNDEKNWFKPGNLPLNVYEISSGDEKVKIGMMVCFDWIFPEVARTLALKGAQIICHPANLVMPYCQDAMVTRALENHVFTITANRIGKENNGGKELYFTGMSEIVNPKGKILSKSPEQTEECVIIDIDPKESLDKFINLNNDLFADRREEFYFK
ncbi:MAG: nitrilase-related carbon-nitrogen hydrolase [Ignavibacteria bacterium]